MKNVFSKYEVVSKRWKNPALLLLTLLGVSHDCRSQQQSNFQFFASLTDSLLNIALSEVVLEGVNQAVIKSLDDNKLNWFFEDRLIAALRHRRIRSVDVGEQASLPQGSPTLVFEYKDVELGFKFEKRHKDQDSQEVEKIAGAYFFIKVTEQNTRRVLLNRKLESTRGGRFHPEDRIEINKASSKSNKKGIIQPILVSSVAGVIVYLFYALRSR